MEYEPDEWRGRHPRDREGWPTHGGGGSPGSPRSHRRARHADGYDDYDGPPTDTGIEFPRHHEPPEPIVIEPVVHVFEREGQQSILSMVRDVAVIMACLVVLFFGGLIIKFGGVPMWLP